MSKYMWLRVIAFLLYLLSVNLLSGYVAIEMRYPSLWNVHASFWEYAAPLPVGWGFAHIPSMFLYGVPLLLLADWQPKHIRLFRILCSCSFLLLFLELDNKVPFVLFSKVDAFTALIFSLALAPPNQRDNPWLTRVLKVVFILLLLVGAYRLYMNWQHQTPMMTKTTYIDGAFELKAIKVDTSFRKEMIFEVDLKRTIVEETGCKVAQSLAIGLLNDYPFDTSYNKIVVLNFAPDLSTPSPQSGLIGEISLNHEHKGPNGEFSCFFQYRK